MKNKCAKCGCPSGKCVKGCKCDCCKTKVKETLTFKEFLRILDEDLGSDIAKLTGDIAMIDTQVAQKTNPLMQQKQRLQKMLALKQKQKEVEDKRVAQQQAKNKQPVQASNQQPSGQQPQGIQAGA